MQGVRLSELSLFATSVVALLFSDLLPRLLGKVLFPQWDEGLDLWCGADCHTHEGHVRADLEKAQTKGRHWARLTKPTSTKSLGNIQMPGEATVTAVVWDVRQTMAIANKKPMRPRMPKEKYGMPRRMTGGH